MLANECTTFKIPVSIGALVADIVEAPDSVMALLPYISAVMPAIELPEQPQ